jgi:hypothetical protein
MEMGCSCLYQVPGVAVPLVASSSLGFASDGNVIALQMRVRDMTDQAIIMQQSMDENPGVLADSLNQTSAQLVATQEKMAELQHAVQASRRSIRSASLTWQTTTLTESTSNLSARTQAIENRTRHR